MMINRKSSLSFIGVLGVLLLLTASCDPTAKYKKAEREEIDAYFTSNPLLVFEHKTSGLYYLNLVTGTGPAPVRGDSVFVFATGTYLDGTVFWSNVALGKLYGFKSNMGENIAGFDEAIMLMREGGKSTIVVPSDLAYGATGTDWIPAFKPLKFDIELVHIKPASVK